MIQGWLLSYSFVLEKKHSLFFIRFLGKDVLDSHMMFSTTHIQNYFLYTYKNIVLTKMRIYLQIWYFFYSKSRRVCALICALILACKCNFPPFFLDIMTDRSTDQYVNQISIAHEGPFRSYTSTNNLIPGKVEALWRWRSTGRCWPRTGAGSTPCRRSRRGRGMSSVKFS